LFKIIQSFRNENTNFGHGLKGNDIAELTQNDTVKKGRRLKTHLKRDNSRCFECGEWDIDQNTENSLELFMFTLQGKQLTRTQSRMFPSIYRKQNKVWKIPSAQANTFIYSRIFGGVCK
jgi:hypothetical protein